MKNQPWRPTCEAILAKTGGDVNKIRQCLDEEHKVILAIEDCVKESVGGQIGCTNDAVPKNLTIPLVPVIQIPVDGPLPTRRRRAPDSVQAPPELAQFLVCVDHCSMASKTRSKRSAITCAYKLQCALAPPDEKVTKSFVQCEHKLNVNPDERFKKSCQCLKEAGISSIKCE